MITHITQPCQSPRDHETRSRNVRKHDKDDPYGFLDRSSDKINDFSMQKASKNSGLIRDILLYIHIYKYSVDRSRTLNIQGTP